MTQAELLELYERVPAVGLKLGRTSNAIYGMLQRGELDGLCIGGKWYVEKESVERFKRAAGTARARATALRPTIGATA